MKTLLVIAAVILALCWIAVLVYYYRIDLRIRKWAREMLLRKLVPEVKIVNTDSVFSRMNLEQEILLSGLFEEETEQKEAGV